MMEKRLKLAKPLLKPDGVLIVTIDEHEVHNLALLMQDLMPDRQLQMLTIVHNPKGTYKRDLSRVEEYALLSMPGDRETVGPLPVELFAQVQSPEQLLRARDAIGGTEDLYLRRRGQHSGHRYQRPNQFYAILVEEKTEKVVGVGPALGPSDPWEPRTENGVVWVYPVDTRGDERVWRYSRETMQEYIEQGAIVVTRRTSRSQQGWVLNHRIERAERLRRVKTVWWEKRHDAGAHGSDLLTALLGDAAAFPYPKSLYAVRDALATIASNRPRAIVLDFFAGSGTTLHATALLNAEDGGSRQCILVTNNDVSDAQAKALNARGCYVGDPDYEAQGIFEAVTKPRVAAAITGRRPDGQSARGEYIWSDRRPLSDGFSENVAFFSMDYLEPDLAELGRQFEAIAPLLWMAAGSIGSWEPWDGTSAWSAPPGSSYAVLFSAAQAAAFGAYVESRSGEITHAWIVTDSHSAFLDAQAELPKHVVAGQLYRDYLRNFVVNAPGVVR